ncbi:DUF4959 domain-containing protein [Flavivirga aquimarina]|uniref:DUF4959 domain-containing protein n=1 Tax=Flavivirga aquimarina TaxID=2027862 RepID=A0ABT8W8T0_9FLAO|nr:DUF4959 domain-containing protein [Flavivirga aquimarina]MDO5969538.1 DUF4959 domain-containing protein [Flavivirga aquimarina]
MKKYIFNYKSYTIKAFIFLCFSMLIVLCSCNDDETNGDTTPPEEVTNVTFEPNNGGGTFFYDVPEDEDVLLVKAVYKLDSEKTIFRASSFYSDSLKIDGLGSLKPYTVELIAVDRAGNESKPVIQEVTPLTPTTQLVLATVEVIPSFSSVFVRWKNPQRKNIVIGVNYTVNGFTVIKKFASNELSEKILIDNLETSSHDISVFIEDDFENKTSAKVFNIEPLGDVLLDKTKFSFLRDELLPDEMHETWVELDDQGMEITQNRTVIRSEKEGGFEGNWNAEERNPDGEIQYFWDGIIDDGILRNKNFFSTGLSGSVPFSYYIDLGEEVVMSRFRVWQQDWNQIETGKDQSGNAYSNGNVEIFELWVSNDKVNWERIRKAIIVKPFDEIEAKQEALDGHHFIVYEEDPRFTKPFRYLEYRGLQRFDEADGTCYASELSIYGNPN